MEKKKLFRAFHDVGFIYLTGHSITESTMQTLFNDNAGGLQVKGRGGQWVDAPPIPGCAIVNGT